MAEQERHPAWDRIERDVTATIRLPESLIHRPGEHEIELSKAISLKRIADDTGVIRALISQIEMNTRNNTP